MSVEVWPDGENHDALDKEPFESRGTLLYSDVLIYRYIYTHKCV